MNAMNAPASAQGTDSSEDAEDASTHAVSHALVREYLSRRGLVGTLAALDAEEPRVRAFSRRPCALPTGSIYGVSDMRICGNAE